MSEYAIIFPLPRTTLSARSESYWSGRDFEEELSSTEDENAVSIDFDEYMSEKTKSTASLTSESYSSFDTNQRIAAFFRASNCRVAISDARIDLELLEQSVKDDFSTQVPRNLFRTSNPLPPSKNGHTRGKHVIQNAMQFDLVVNLGNTQHELMKTFADFSRLKSDLEYEFQDVKKIDKLGVEKKSIKYNIPDLPTIQNSRCNGTFRTMLRFYLTTYRKSIETWLQSVCDSVSPVESPVLINFLLQDNL